MSNHQLPVCNYVNRMKSTPFRLGLQVWDQPVPTNGGRNVLLVFVKFMVLTIERKLKTNGGRCAARPWKGQHIHPCHPPPNQPWHTGHLPLLKGLCGPITSPPPPKKKKRTTWPNTDTTQYRQLPTDDECPSAATLTMAPVNFCISRARMEKGSPLLTEWPGKT